MPSPLVEIKNGAAAYVSAAGGVNVTPGNTIVIRLVSTDADVWECPCLTTDNGSDAGSVIAACVVDTFAKTVTFTAPAAGATYRFRSTVNRGRNGNNVADSTFSTTFCIYTVKNGRRKLSTDEKFEGNATFGWISVINDIIDSLPSGAGSSWSAGGGGGAGVGLFGADFEFITYQGGSAVGATGMNHVPTTGVIEISRGLRVVGTAVATLASAMLVGGTAATGFQLTRPVMLSPILGGTTVFTGLDMVADGLADHKPVSVIRRHVSIDATATCIFAFKPTDEAITNVFAEVNAVASGGAGGGSYARAVAIKMDGGVGTCSALESTRSMEFTHSGVGFTGIGVGSGIWIGVSGATGFVNVKGTATGQIKWGATVTLQTTSWA